MKPTANSLQTAKTTVQKLGGIALILAPLLTLTGWAISHDSVSSFFSFNMSHKDTNGTITLTRNSDPNLIFRYFLLPHYFIYASMPVYIALGLTLMRTTYIKSPWYAFIGSMLNIIGAVYFIGVLGAYLSNPIGSVLPTNILKLSFALCFLVFMGNILLGIALYRSKITSAWAALSFISGNLLILIFPGIENWMALASFLMILGLYPLARKILNRNILKHTYDH